VTYQEYLDYTSIKPRKQPVAVLIHESTGLPYEVIRHRVKVLKELTPYDYGDVLNLKQFNYIVHGTYKKTL
jgi:hypothetical protein